MNSLVWKEIALTGGRGGLVDKSAGLYTVRSIESAIQILVLVDSWLAYYVDGGAASLN